MKTQRFDISGNTVVTDVFLTCCMMNFSEKKYKENCTKAKFVFKLKSFEAKWQKVFSFADDEIQSLLEVCTEYKTKREYCGTDWESVRNNNEQIQEKLIQQYPKNSTDGFPNSENAKQTLTVKRIGGKLKGALSGMRQFLATESPLKLMKKCFLFRLNSPFLSQDI